MSTTGRVVVIGGSAGSFRPVCTILRSLPASFDFVLLLVLHRLKNMNAGFEEALRYSAPGYTIVEPFDKQPVEKGKVYLAPANYHLAFETETAFALSSDPPIQYSRPSIDYSFYSAADRFGPSVTAVILSGANRDAVAGAVAVHAAGGQVIVQDPSECEIQTMPGETLKAVPGARVMTQAEIGRFLHGLSA